MMDHGVKQTAADASIALATGGVRAILDWLDQH
jgi:hypothetical protein